MKDPKDLNFYEIFSYSTTRIECKLKNGGHSTGTGFFLFLNDFENRDEEERIVIITNKHVIENAEEGKLTLTTKKNGKILNTKHFSIPHENFESAWIPHPDDSVDLCLLNFNPYENIFQGKGTELFYTPIPCQMIPNRENIKTFDTLEDVIMIGYPNGIWDSYNNKPIFRKGVTATDYRLDYNNKSEFIIDMAVYGGSSGSPILTTKRFLDQDDNEITRTFLLGILYAGFQHTANGEIKIVEIPQSQKAFVKTSIPNNLGIVIKAEELNVFRKMFYR